ncbi:MAG: PLDc_N domain-containing protein [Ruminococcaceae bacterium]|jgi:ABC-type methionine transport system permease subunit|nr:PLDc_N domain-containing protein [Oscillospiraceae bacterium]
MLQLEQMRELLIMVSPLIAIQLGLAVYCVIKICKEGVANLNRWSWILICLFVNIIGSIAFLIIGRKKVS